jgi:probable HAF family extracellular repeat protein
MKFYVSFASVALVILALPLLWVNPGGQPNEAQSSRAQSSIKTIYPTFTTIDVPDEPITEIYGINSRGDMVGFTARSYYDPHDRGFLYKDGKFIRVVYPGAYATFANGINDAGLIIGEADLQHGYLAKGFTYDGKTFTLFHHGSGGVTIGQGINNLNSIVGGFGTLDFRIGFMQNGRQFTKLHFPGNNGYETATGINDLGQIVGYTYPDLNAYLYVNGRFKNIDVPGAVQTEALGINDSGVISGNYFTSPAVYGFALYNGQYISFSYPGAEGTYADGINDSGQVVGWYTLDYVAYHGFVTSPVTPADFQ